MIDAFILSQIFAGAALVFDIVSFQLSQRKHILMCFMLSAFMLSIHFYLIGLYTAATIGLLSVVRFIIFIYTKHINFLYIFLAAATVIFVVTYQGLLSVIAYVATCCFTLGAFQKNDKWMRLIIAVAIVLWLIHNILAGSYMGVLIELVFLMSNVLGYYRRYIKPQEPLNYEDI